MRALEGQLRRARVASFVVALVASFATSVAACARGAPNDAEEDGGPNAGAGAACQLCVTDQDCADAGAGAVCAQFGGDSFCAPACPTGNECGGGTSCTSATTVDGQQRSVCIPITSACGDGTTGSDASAPPPSTTTCGTLVAPSVKAACHSCGTGTTTTQTCQANGCYGGWWCNTAGNRCQAPPTSCSGGGDGGGALHVDAGGPITGSVGSTGGKVSRLYFAVVGDTRPPAINDTSAYPSPIIQSIYGDIEASTPRPSFVVATGDYVFASTYGSTASTQMGLYLAARKSYSGVVFPALGNHECTGAVASNCGPGNADGITTNYTAFLSQLLSPIGKTSPNYEIEIDASDGTWTSKVVFVAGNAWTSADATWLDATLARPTTYTFILRHEPRNAYQAPGCAASEPIMAKYPYTLAIVGHTHTYGRTGARQVTIGNGGAPLVAGTNYGYGIIAQRADGTIGVDMIDYASGQADASFHFALHPDGSSAP